MVKVRKLLTEGVGERVKESNPKPRSFISLVITLKMNILLIQMCQHSTKLTVSTIS